MNPQQYCQEKAAKSGSSFYYSFRFLPETQRNAIIALYAFCREVDDIVDKCSDANIASNKLDWWREEITNTFAGRPSHPVSHALSEHINRLNLPEEYFKEIIDGMAMDLDHPSYPSFKELSLYCYRAASVVGLMSVEIFSYQDRRTLKYAHDLGIALQLTNIIRDVREDAQRGRVYLPQDELAQFGVSNDDLQQGKTTENFRTLMKFQADRARQYYQSAFRHLPDIDRYQQRSGIIMAEIYLSTLNEIEAEGLQVLEQRTSLTPLRKLWIAWNIARKEKQRYKKQQASILITNH